MVAMQLGSLRLPAGGGVGEEQEEWRTPYHPSSREQKIEARPREAEGVGSMNGKDPVQAFSMFGRPYRIVDYLLLAGLV